VPAGRNHWSVHIHHKQAFWCGLVNRSS
jgi:hypothetical protein